jgi:hypothetical protein
MSRWVGVIMGFNALKQARPDGSHLSCALTPASLGHLAGPEPAIKLGRRPVRQRRAP